MTSIDELSDGQYRSAADTLYRFFAAFEGFDDALQLDFEDERYPARSPAAEDTVPRTGGIVRAPIAAAVFSMEPGLSGVRRYIHGGTTYVCTCAIRARVYDADTDARRRTAAFFDALAAYAVRAGQTFEAEGRTYRIRLSGHPARIALHADGAVWELQFRVELYTSI